MNWSGRKVALLIAALLAIVSPLPFGAVEDPAVAALLTLTALGLLALWFDRNELAAPPRGLVVLAAATALLPWLWLAPLPPSVASLLSPTVAHARAANAEQQSTAVAIAALGARTAPDSRSGWHSTAADPDGARYGAARITLYCGAFLLALLSAPSLGARRLMAGAIGVSAVLQAGYGLAESLSGHHSIFGTLKTHYLPLPTGTFICPNHFAALLSMGLFSLLGAMALLTKERSADNDHSAWWARHALIATLLAVVTLALIWSSSRGALVAAAIGLATLAALLLLRARSRRAGGRAGAALAAIGIVAPLVVAGSIWLRPPAPLGDDVSRVAVDLTGREQIWSAARAVALGYARWGSGPGTYPIAQALFRPVTQGALASHAHNDYLEWWAESGPLGLLLAIGWMVTLGSGALAVLRRAEGGALSAAWIAALLALALHEAVDFSLQLPGVGVTAALLAGALFAPLPWGPSETLDRRRSPGPRHALVALAALGLLLGAWIVIDPVSGPDLWVSPEALRREAHGELLAMIAAAKTDSPPADLIERLTRSLATATRAVELSPLRSDALLTLWLATQARASVRQPTEELPRGFDDYSTFLLQRAEALDPSSRELKLELARLYLQSDHPEQAARCAKRFIEWLPWRSREAYRILGGADLSLPELMAATPNLPAPALELVSLLRERKDYVGAQIVLERAASQHPESSSLRRAWAQQLAERGQAARALEVVTKSPLPQDSRERRLMLNAAANFAATLQDRGRFDQALSALRADGEDPRVLAVLQARFLLSLGDAARAVQVLREPLAGSDQDWPEGTGRAEAWRLMGRAQARLGVYREALEAYRRVLEADPDDDEAKRFIAGL